MDGGNWQSGHFSGRKEFALFPAPRASPLLPPHPAGSGGRAVGGKGSGESEGRTHLTLLTVSTRRTPPRARHGARGLPHAPTPEAHEKEGVTHAHIRARGENLPPEAGTAGRRRECGPRSGAQRRQHDCPTPESQAAGRDNSGHTPARGSTHAGLSTPDGS